MREQQCEVKLKTSKGWKPKVKVTRETEKLWQQKHLDLFFTEMVTSVMKSLWLFPRTLSCLQIVVIVISITETMFYPNTITAAWRRAQRTNATMKAQSEKWLTWDFCSKLPFLASFAWLCASLVWYVSAHSGCTALSPALGSCKACSVFLESPLATILLISAIAPATNRATNLSQRTRNSTYNVKINQISISITYKNDIVYVVVLEYFKYINRCTVDKYDEKMLAMSITLQMVRTWMSELILYIRARALSSSWLAVCMASWIWSSHRTADSSPELCNQA